MSNAVIGLKWNEFLRKFLIWQKNRHSDQGTKVNSAREHSISRLQQRYGYTREQATYQLDKHYPRAWLG
jgi:hypothetical protein